MKNWLIARARRAPASRRRALTVTVSRALAVGLAGLRMAASMAPKGTKCDFGGSGTEKRKGCQFPLYKNSARAHRSIQSRLLGRGPRGTGVGVNCGWPVSLGWGAPWHWGGF